MPARPRILCVDDEPSVLDALSASLRRDHDVVAIAGASAALEALTRDPTIAVILSDLRMPGMDGATFLGKARAIAPDAARLLLVAQGELDLALAAMNEGRIFRFVIKPCTAAALLAAVDAAVELHRLLTAERILLEQTLRGSIKVLTEVLALAAPDAFGQALRVQRHARDLASRAGAQVWAVEVAAMLSPIGCITLPAAILDKLKDGRPLAAEEQQAVDKLPALAEQFIAAIPRLEDVRAALRHQTTPFDGNGAPPGTPRGKDIPLGARILSIVYDFERLEARGLSPQLAIDTLRGRRGRYDPELLELFAAKAGGGAQEVQVLEIPMRLVRIGMTFIEDVRAHSGALLVARGQDVTASLFERLRNFAPGSVREPVRVVLKGTSRTVAAAPSKS